MIGPPPKQELQVFESLPPANQNTFNSGLRATTVTTEEALSIILYSPNLQLIATQDNTNSQSSSKYSRSVSRGFTFGMSQELSITQSAGVNFVLVTGGVSTTFAITFSQAWTTVETWTYESNCPAGARVFAYQGTLMSRVLRFESSTAQYSWKTSESKTLTEIFRTSPTSLGSMPSDSVSIQQQ